MRSCHTLIIFAFSFLSISCDSKNKYSKVENVIKGYLDDSLSKSGYNIDSIRINKIDTLTERKITQLQALLFYKIASVYKMRAKVQANESSSKGEELDYNNGYVALYFKKERLLRDTADLYLNAADSLSGIMFSFDDIKSTLLLINYSEYLSQKSVYVKKRDSKLFLTLDGIVNEMPYKVVLP